MNGAYQPRATLYNAAGVVDADRTSVGGGGMERAAVLVEHATDPDRSLGALLLSAGRSGDVARHPAAATARRVELGQAVITPGFVNTHTHLDLTHLGPTPHPSPATPGRGFAQWAGIVMRGRRKEPEGIRASVELGVARCLEGGVVAIGDIAGVGSLEAARAVADSPLKGVSFVECFGLGSRQEAGVEAIRRAHAQLSDLGITPAFSPHAPYSAALSIYEAAQELAGGRVCTHLAESIEERAFVASASGPLRELLGRLGLWETEILQELGRGSRPIEHLRPALERGPMLLAHVNDATDEEIELVARSGSSVVFCPRCHTYFGHEAAIGRHRYREMLSAGIPVALGTDSILNLPGDPHDVAGWPALSTLDEARLLVRRDGLDARTALAMCTTLGAQALGLAEDSFRLTPGEVAGLCAVAVEDSSTGGPAEWVMRSDAPARLLTASDGA